MAIMVEIMCSRKVKVSCCRYLNSHGLTCAVAAIRRSHYHQRGHRRKANVKRAHHARAKAKATFLASSASFCKKVVAAKKVTKRVANKRATNRHRHRRNRNRKKKWGQCRAHKCVKPGYRSFAVDALREATGYHYDHRPAWRKWFKAWPRESLVCIIIAS